MLTATKTYTILLQDEQNRPIGAVVRVDGHWVFYDMSEMGDEAIAGLFENNPKL